MLEADVTLLEVVPTHLLPSPTEMVPLGRPFEDSDVLLADIIPEATEIRTSGDASFDPSSLLSQPVTIEARSPVSENGVPALGRPVQASANSGTSGSLEVPMTAMLDRGGDTTLFSGWDLADISSDPFVDVTEFEITFPDWDRDGVMDIADTDPLNPYVTELATNEIVVTGTRLSETVKFFIDLGEDIEVFKAGLAGTLIGGAAGGFVGQVVGGDAGAGMGATAGAYTGQTVAEGIARENYYFWVDMGINIYQEFDRYWDDAGGEKLDDR